MKLLLSFSGPMRGFAIFEWIDGTNDQNLTNYNYNNITLNVDQYLLWKQIKLIGAVYISGMFKNKVGAYQKQLDLAATGASGSLGDFENSLGHVRFS